MKTLILTLLLLTTPALASDWCINGIPVDRFKDAGVQEWSQLAGGVAASFLVHWASHVAYFEATGVGWHQEGLEELFNTKGLSGAEIQWCGRSGFIGQLAVGFALEYSPWKESWFTTGYHIQTAVEATTYPLRGHKDFDTIDQGGGHGSLEWGLYSAASVWLLISSPKFHLNLLCSNRLFCDQPQDEVTYGHDAHKNLFGNVNAKCGQNRHDRRNQYVKIQGF